MACREQGDLAGATQAFRKVLRLDKDHADAHLNLGSCLGLLGETDEALRHFARAAALAPRSPVVLLSQAQAFLDAGLPHRALAAADKALALAPGLVPALVLRAHALARLDHYTAARAAWRAAVAQAPEAPRVLNDAATFLMQDNRLSEAVALQQKARALAPDDRLIRRNLITVLMTEGQVEAAEAEVRAWIADIPDDAWAWRLLGDVLVRAGRFEAGRAALEKAWDLAPADDSIAVALTTTGRMGPDVPAADRILAREAEARAQGGLSVDLAYAAGKVHDDRKEWDAAFAAYSVANQTKGRLQPFDADAHDDEVAALIDTFTPALFERLRGVGSPSEVPVFVVGLPRSGTTLVEQIIASHPEAGGAGELTHFPRLEAELPWLTGDGTQAYPACVAGLRPETLAPFTAAYLETLAHFGGAGARRVVDKLPNNFLRLGLIALAFPRARVVFCQRDLADTCLSLHFQNFMGAHAYRHDLRTLGRYARASLRLKAHWETVLPLPLLTLDYAALVADPETESRRLLDFVGLSWDPAVLAFHQRRVQPVATASRWQVRQPITTRSVARWRAYESHLGPLLETLAD
ncbi:Sulfotransferase [Pararhodospirillum photometricum DSM 122]|uniref:Sulfotransferase n=1 Tax=Pararhodospirillum photometricum DSM 122 TaxID=1150469 RepID=H6SJI9_PARPM|nr:Sulfotransferase [Pararhodospirillum photometricum DSM 122]